MARNVFKWGLLAYVAVTFCVIAWQELRAGQFLEEPRWDEGDYLVVTYFHADKRCTMCNDMETFTWEALDLHAPGGVASGRVKKRTLHWQAPANTAYVRKYGLIGNAVIVSEIRDGREARFKNLSDIWSHAHDRKAYVDYVRSELQAFAGGR